jgi:hypothetical protein
MSRTKSHNWWFAVIHKPKDKKSIVTLTLCYKYDMPKRFGTTIRIPYECWDIKAKDIRILSKYSHLSLETYSNLLLTYKQRIAHVKSEMSEGRMTYQTGAEYILNTQKDELLSDYLTPAFLKKGLKKYTDRVGSVENHLTNGGYSNLVPLSFNTLMDERCVKQIVECLRDTPSVIQNTAHDYLTTINSLCNKVRKRRPITEFGLMPERTDHYGANPVPYTSILDALNKVNSKQQYEAIIFWLYMFCLTGIDAIDIANTSEDNIDKDDLKHIKENGLKHYHPEYMFYGTMKQFGRKIYRTGRRSKNNALIGGTLLNLFPTLTLHRILKQLIKETHPEYAYQGADCLRLFNFLTKDKMGRDLEVGSAKWTAYRGVMSKNLKKLGMGKGFKQVRDTFTMQGEEIGVDKGKLQEYLGHSKNKEVITHYRSPSQTEKDTYHTQIIQEFNIVQLTKLAVTIGQDCGYLPIAKKEVDGIIRGTLVADSELPKDSILTGADYLLFDVGKLTQWDIKKELRLQRLLKQFRDKPIAKVIDGKVVYTNDPKDAPQELKDLLKEKEELFILQDIGKEYSNA